MSVLSILQNTISEIRTKTTNAACFLRIKLGILSLVSLSVLNRPSSTSRIATTPTIPWNVQVHGSILPTETQNLSSLWGLRNTHPGNTRLDYLPDSRGQYGRALYQVLRSARNCHRGRVASHSDFATNDSLRQAAPPRFSRGRQIASNSQEASHRVSARATRSDNRDV